MTTTLNPLTTALIDILEAVYVDHKVRDGLYEVPGGELVLDLLIDYIGDSDGGADNLEHYLRWVLLNRGADERVVTLHQHRVDALLEVNVRARNHAIDTMEAAEARVARGELVGTADDPTYAHALDEWHTARRDHEQALEDQANLTEVLEASNARDLYAAADTMEADE
jgi:hypothetical protein